MAAVKAATISSDHKLQTFGCFAISNPLAKGRGSSEFNDLPRLLKPR